MAKGYTAKDAGSMQRAEKRQLERDMNPKPTLPIMAYTPPVKAPAVAAARQAMTEYFSLEKSARDERARARQARRNVDVDLALQKVFRKVYNIDSKPTEAEATQIYRESRLDTEYFKTHVISRELATMVAEMYLKNNLVVPAELQKYANTISKDTSGKRAAILEQDLETLIKTNAQTYESSRTNAQRMKVVRQTITQLGGIRKDILRDPGLLPEELSSLLNKIDDFTGQMDVLIGSLRGAAEEPAAAEGGAPPPPPGGGGAGGAGGGGAAPRPPRAGGGAAGGGAAPGLDASMQAIVARIGQPNGRTGTGKLTINSEQIKIALRGVNPDIDEVELLAQSRANLETMLRAASPVLFNYYKRPTAE